MKEVIGKFSFCVLVTTGDPYNFPFEINYKLRINSGLYLYSIMDNSWPFTYSEVL